MTSDLLNDLHTLRSLAHSVKALADAQRLWQIAAIVATISEEATICIEKLSSHEKDQKSPGEHGDTVGPVHGVSAPQV